MVQVAHIKGLGVVHSPVVHKVTHVAPKVKIFRGASSLGSEIENVQTYANTRNPNAFAFLRNLECYKMSLDLNAKLYFA